MYWALLGRLFDCLTCKRQDGLFGRPFLVCLAPYVAYMTYMPWILVSSRLVSIVSEWVAREIPEKKTWEFGLAISLKGLFAMDCAVFSAGRSFFVCLASYAAHMTICSTVSIVSYSTFRMNRAQAGKKNEELGIWVTVLLRHWFPIDCAVFCPEQTADLVP